MSKESVVNFFKAVENDADLKSRLEQVERTMDGWIAFGKDNGFEFDSSELLLVSEALTDKKLTDASCIDAVIDSMNALSDADLSAVAGGAAGSLSFSTRLSRIGFSAPGSDRGYISDRGPSWVDSPGSNLGGTGGQL